MAKSILIPAAFLALCIYGAQAGRFLKSQDEYPHEESFNHTAWSASLKNHTSSLFNHTTIAVPEITVSIYNHTMNKTNTYLEELSNHVASFFNHSEALFNYTKPINHTAKEEDAEKYEFSSLYHHTNLTSIALQKLNHTNDGNITFYFPSFNHSSHANKTGVLANATTEYEDFVEKHG